MRLILLLLASLATTGAAQAQGFAIRDLSQVAEPAKAALGDGYVDRAAPERVTLMCTGCAGSPMIDVLLGRQTDGTEDRVRSGETTIRRLEEQCQARSPECRLSGLKVSPAVGWITSYRIGSTAGSTAVIINGGDLLTIRSLASTPAIARGNAERLVKAIVPSIVGR